MSYKNLEEITDTRSVLANNTAKLIIEKYNNVARATREGRDILIHFKDTVEGIDELLFTEIPFFGLCELLMHQKSKGKSLGYSQKEYEKKVSELTKFCVTFYNITEIKEEISGD